MSKLLFGLPRQQATRHPWRRLLRVVCHEHRRSKRRCVTAREVKEGPSDSAIRSLIPSYRELLRSKAVVASVAETPGHRTRQARSREASASKLLLKRRKQIR
jgi:hypothetical protein